MTIKIPPPPGLDPERYSLCLLGPLALGLSLGIQVTVTALLLLGPANPPAFDQQLTEYGKTLFHPEHDLAIFVAGSALTLAAALVAVWFWRAKLASLEAAKGAKAMLSSALFQGVLAAVSLLACLSLASSCWFSSDFQSAPSAARPLPGLADGVALLLPGAVALLCALIDLECGWSYLTAADVPGELWRQRVNRILLYATPLLIILLVGVPPGSWSYLAGRFFLTDECHHLNFFVMGPALAFAHGKAFGTELYSQYGIGWPLLHSMLSPLLGDDLRQVRGPRNCLWLPLLPCAVLPASALLPRGAWAAIGVVLAIYWQVFSGQHLGEIIWLYPSSTPMRHPLDVWFFFALVMHLRSGRICWAGWPASSARSGCSLKPRPGFTCW